jgi:hypothetical protein
VRRGFINNLSGTHFVLRNQAGPQTRSSPANLKRLSCNFDVISFYPTPRLNGPKHHFRTALLNSLFNPFGSIEEQLAYTFVCAEVEDVLSPHGVGKARQPICRGGRRRFCCIQMWPL